ncbi:MAG: hypothetical protein FJW34_23055 [Acidobacteria bacterium]|nr:hypothetical protein [Acidobacteriota bacterium]
MAQAVSPADRQAGHPLGGLSHEAACPPPGPPAADLPAAGRSGPSRVARPAARPTPTGKQ